MHTRPSTRPCTFLPKGVALGLFTCILHMSNEAMAAPEPADEPKSVFQDVIVDNLLGMSASTTGVTFVSPVSLSMPDGEVKGVRLAANLHYRTHDFVTLGVKVSVDMRETTLTRTGFVYGYSRGTEIVTWNTYSVLGAVGLVGRLGEHTAIWPNVAMGVAIDYLSVNTRAMNGFIVEGEAPLVYALSENMFFALGPGVQGRTGRSSERGIGFGLNARLGVTF